MLKAKQERQSTYNVTLSRFHEAVVAVGKQELLHMSVCVCVCVCVSVCLCSHAWCMCEFGRVGLSMLVRACSLAYSAAKSYSPCYDVISSLSGSTTFFDIIC
jgi:hypothetical protein